MASTLFLAEDSHIHKIHRRVRYTACFISVNAVVIVNFVVVIIVVVGVIIGVPLIVIVVVMQ